MGKIGGVFLSAAITLLAGNGRGEDKAPSTGSSSTSSSLPQPPKPFFAAITDRCDTSPRTCT